MRHFRSFRGSRRGNGMRPVIQSFKKVINSGPGNVVIGNLVESLSIGVDNVTVGQTSVSDTNVPTGALIKYIEIQHSCGNVGVTNNNAFIHWSIQQVHSDQSLIPANAVGGNPKRNQVFRQGMFQLGLNQSNNRVHQFKVPKQFQRVREGDSWNFTWVTDSVVSSAFQIIYKFYR